MDVRKLLEMLILKEMIDDIEINFSIFWFLEKLYWNLKAFLLLLWLPEFRLHNWAD